MSLMFSDFLWLGSILIIIFLPLFILVEHKLVPLDLPDINVVHVDLDILAKELPEVHSDFVRLDI